MTIAFVALDDQYVNAATTVTVNVPTGAAAGDMLICIIATVPGRSGTAGGPFSMGSGVWTRLGGGATGSTMWGAIPYYRVMQSGDTSWTFTSASSGANRGVVLAYTDTTPDWCITGTTETEDTSALTAYSDGTRISDGVALNIGISYRSTLMTGISIDNGTSRLASVNTQIGIAVSDSTTGGSFTSTTTGSTPTDHFTFALSLQSTPTGEVEPAEGDLVDAAWFSDGYIYKGRDTATADTVGAA